MLLGEGSTSGIIDQTARLVAVQGTFFFDRTKAALMSYLAGVLKNQIPPYCSYNRNPTECAPTVQEVIGFLTHAVKEHGESNFWMALQDTMDVFERLILARQIPQYLMWPNLATADQMEQVRQEMYEYFQLDTGDAVDRQLKDLFGGLDLSKIGTYLLWGGVIVIGIAILPSLTALVRSQSSPTQ